MQCTRGAFRQTFATISKTATVGSHKCTCEPRRVHHVQVVSQRSVRNFSEVMTQVHMFAVHAIKNEF